jgi:nitroreductase
VETLWAAAAERQVARREYRQELGEVIGRGDLGTPWPLSRVGRVAAASARLARGMERLERGALRSAPLLALVGTPGDDHRAHLRSGQVLERLWLAATALGLGLQPMSAAVEVPEVREELGRVFGMPERFRAQELVRIGRPRGPGGLRTPRRQVGDTDLP